MTGGVREYARHRGVSHVAVLHAIDKGKIGRTKDGKIDFERADAAWPPASTPPVRAAAGLARNIAGGGNGHKPIEAAPARVADPDGYLTHRARREKADAELAELKVQRARGEVVDAAEVSQAVGAMGRMHAAAREALPAQLAALLVGKTDIDEVERLIRAELRACDERVANEIEARYSNLVKADRGDGGLPADGNSLASHS